MGEGGFAYVYAAIPADAPPAMPPTLALKRTLGPDPDRLATAAGEASALASSAAPSTLPLLASGRDGPAFHLLTPLASGGNLADAVGARCAARLSHAGYRIDGPPPSARLAAAAGAIPPRLALGLLSQAAAGVAACHAAGLIHCDVKPHNLLLVEGAGLSTADEEEEGAAGLAPPREEEEEDEAASAASLRASGAGSSRPSTRPPSAAVGAATAPPLFPTLVLADFGSARPDPVPLPTRAAALALAEWADAHTSQPYRPPELFDPPSGPAAQVTSAVDVWGLGCVLFFLLAGGVSPFEQRGGGGGPAGGSLALAVLAGRVTWPDQGSGGFGAGAASSASAPSRRVVAARALAEACLAADPAARPTAAEVAARARALAR